MSLGPSKTNGVSTRKAERPKRGRSSQEEYYLSIQRKYPPFTSRDAFLEKYEDYKAGSIEARDEIIYRHMGLALKCAARHRGRGAEYDDLVQACLMALVTDALPRFDEERGAEFTTCAWWWMRHGCSRLITDTASYRPYRVPQYAQHRQLAISRARQQLALAGKSATDDEIIASLNPERAEQIKQSVGTQWALGHDFVYSLEAPFSESGLSFSDVLHSEDDSYRNPITLLVTEEASRRVLDALERRPSRSQDILKSYFGLGREEEMRQAIADRLCLSRQRVCRILEDDLVAMARETSVSVDEVTMILEAVGSRAAHL